MAKNGGKRQKWKTQIRHFQLFANIALWTGTNSILEEKYIFWQICIFFLNLHALWMQLSNVTYELPAKKFTKLFTKLFCQEKSKTRKSTFKSFQEVFLLRFCSFSDWQTDFRLNMYVHFRHVQRRLGENINW